jgi:hypothetical protein
MIKAFKFRAQAIFVFEDSLFWSRGFSPDLWKGLRLDSALFE